MKEELTMTETAGTEILEESVKSQDIRWYENVQYDDAKIYIRAHITSAARNFISIGYYLKYVRDHEMYTEEGYKDIWEFAWSEYGISKSTASRYMSMNDRFSKDGNCPYVKEEYKDFGKSQLQEMLSLTEEQPDLPALKNNDQRAAFVDAFESWPLWIETAATGERYYRYDLPDGTSMVIKVYHAMLFDYKVSGVSYEERYSEGYGKPEYYLLREGKFFKDCETNRSTLIEKLKDIQKKERTHEEETV